MLRAFFYFESHFTVASLELEHPPSPSWCWRLNHRVRPADLLERSHRDRGSDQ
jgi:hypothetical protein